MIWYFISHYLLPILSTHFTLFQKKRKKFFFFKVIVSLWHPVDWWFEFYFSLFLISLRHRYQRNPDGAKTVFDTLKRRSAAYPKLFPGKVRNVQIILCYQKYSKFSNDNNILLCCCFDAKSLSVTLSVSLSHRRTRTHAHKYSLFSLSYTQSVFINLFPPSFDPYLYLSLVTSFSISSFIQRLAGCIRSIQSSGRKRRRITERDGGPWTCMGFLHVHRFVNGNWRQTGGTYVNTLWYIICLPPLCYWLLFIFILNFDFLHLFWISCFS